MTDEGTSDAARIERVSIELTGRCEKACSFCYNASHPAGDDGWPLADAVAFVRDLARNGVRAVSFGGGEPLEYPPLDALLDATRGRLFRSLTTNGRRLTDARLDSLAAVRPDKIHVSIHFPGNEAEVDAVIDRVHAIAARGIASGVNLLVRASRLADAARAAARLRGEGIGNGRIVYLPMRGAGGGDTPTPDDLASVAGDARFQSMTCLVACARSPRFVSVGHDRAVAHCSYTDARRSLAEPTYGALVAALDGLPLRFCGEAPRLTGRSLALGTRR